MFLLPASWLFLIVMISNEWWLGCWLHLYGWTFTPAMHFKMSQIQCITQDTNHQVTGLIMYAHYNTNACRSCLSSVWLTARGLLREWGRIWSGCSQFIRAFQKAIAFTLSTQKAVIWKLGQISRLIDSFFIQVGFAPTDGKCKKCTRILLWGIKN